MTTTGGGGGGGGGGGVRWDPGLLQSSQAIVRFSKIETNELLFNYSTL